MTDVGQFPPLPVELSEEVLDDAVRRAKAAVEDGLNALASLLIQYSVQAYNSSPRDEPYREWVVRTALASTVTPWGRAALEGRAILFLQPRFGLQWATHWDSSSLARRMTAQFRLLDADPELSGLMAYTLKGGYDQNIFIKPQDVTTSIERSVQVGGYFD